MMAIENNRMIKVFTSLIIVFVLFGCSHIVAQKPKNFNGWEFLQWKLRKDSVIKILNVYKSKFESPNALDADFKYEGMNTWLEYDNNNQLNKVHQRHDFAVIYLKDAKTFYKKTRARLIKTYGRPGHKEFNRKGCVETLIWELKYTRVVCEFNYQYKIIDEFGAGSYWVDVVFSPE